jgi:hypothetical protein
MQTSTSSDSRSTLAGSKVSSSLRNLVVVNVLEHAACVGAIDLAAAAVGAARLGGADIVEADLIVEAALPLVASLGTKRALRWTHLECARMVALELLVLCWSRGKR